MPYTFGANQTDDANNATGSAAMANNTTMLVTGWWCPTNVAGTDQLWSFGNVAGAQIASTTTINVNTQNATTNGVWQGTVTALTNNTWAYLAFLGTFTNTGPAGAVKMWQGTIDTAPVEVSVAQITAPVGNYTGDQTFYIGNKGTSATDAFDGDIANVTVMFESGTASGFLLSPATAGVCTQNEADLAANHFVHRFWLGDYAKIIEGARAFSSAVKPHLFFDLNNGHTRGNGRANLAVDALLTVNGATPSVVNGNPRPAISRPNWPLRRR